MKKSSLITILQSLNVSELKQLDKFMQSEYFQPNTRAYQLYQLLRKAHPNFDSKAIEKEMLFKKIFGKKEFNAGLLRNVASDLIAAMENFLAIESLKKDVLLQKRLARQSYISKKLFAEAEHNLKTTEVILSKRKKKVESEYFQFDYLQLYDWFSLSFLEKYQGNLFKLYRKKDIQEVIGKLDNYTLLEYSLLVSEMTNSYRAHNKPYNAKFHVERIKLMLTHKEFLHPIIEYRLEHCLMLLTNSKDLYKKVRKDFEQLESEMDDSLRIACLVELHSFASMFGWKGDKFFLNEVDELLGLREKLNLIIDDNGNINPIAFNNLVFRKINRDELNNALQFIKTYTPHLPEVNRTDTLNLSYAAVAFYKKDYSGALAILSTTQKPFFTSEIIYRRLQIKCYYELGEWNSLVNMLENSRKFVENNTTKISPYVIESFKKFIEIVQLLHKNHLKRATAHQKKISTIINSGAFFSEEKWVLEKLNS